MITARTFYGGSEAREINGNVQLGTYSRRVQVLDVQTASLYVRLPDARRVPAGMLNFALVNIGAEDIDIQDALGDSLATLEPSKAALCGVVTQEDAGGTWIVKLGDVNSSDDPPEVTLIYIFGGRAGSTTYGTVWRYSALLDSYETMTTADQARRQAGSTFVVANKAYITQGDSPFVASEEARNWEYTPDFFTERTAYNVSSVNVAGSGRTSIGIGALGYVFTGAATSYQKINQSYSPSGDLWTRLTDYPSSDGVKDRQSLGFDGTNVALVGGANGPSGTASADFDAKLYTIATNAFEDKTSHPQNLMLRASFWDSSYSYFVGGATNTGLGSEVDRTDRLDMAGSWTWATRTDFPGGPRQRLGASYLGAHGYTFGGAESGTSGFEDAYRYDPAGDSWATRAEMPGRRWGIQFQVQNIST